MLPARNPFSSVVTFVAHNDLKFSPSSTISDAHYHESTFTFTQTQADVHDVAFFRKKMGFPKVMDSRMVDVAIGGSGLTAVAHFLPVDNDRPFVFNVKDVRIKVGSLKYSIRDSKYDLLYKTLKPLATVRDRMEEVGSSDRGVSRTQVLEEVSVAGDRRGWDSFNSPRLIQTPEGAQHSGV